MTDSGDPRRKAFSQVPARPELNGVGDLLPHARKLEVGPPPPKRPAIEVADPEISDSDTPSDPALGTVIVEEKASTEEPSSSRQPRAQRNTNRAVEASGAFDPKAYGAKKSRLVWVATMLPKALSARLDETVSATGKPLSALVVDAVRSNHQRIGEELTPPPHDPSDPFPAVSPSLGHYKERGGSVRRDLGVHPGEAEALASLAYKLGITPSALMRRALELALE